MEYTRFHNCLRIQITVDDAQDERIENIVEHCQKYGFDNVMLMLNLEEFNLGHITLEEARPWVEVLKKAKKKLEKNGISVSVNNWIELGQADRGRMFKKGQDFTPMVDMYGRVSTATPCPLCKEFQKYHTSYVNLLMQELQPDTYWIEDDFRLHNHAPLVGYGCFCPLHMAYYNNKLGKNYTREEFVSKIYQKGPCNAERKVFLDANKDVMISLAEIIGKEVKRVNPKTDVALMTSWPEMHCIEARDWNALLSAFAQGTQKINRIHLPYEELTGKENIYYFNSVSMAIRALMNDDDVVVMPEIENSSASFYRRSARYLRFAIEAAAPLVLSGMTYSLYDFVANGTRESMGYGEEIKRVRPFMQAIRDLDLKFSSLSGVVIPIDEKACYKKTIETNGVDDLLPNEYQTAAFISALGVPFSYSTKRKFAKETIFLSGSSVDYFTDEEIKELFADNYVLVEGGAALALKKRGLLSLISAKTAEEVLPDTGWHTYEENEDETTKIDGVRRMRASCRQTAGTFVRVEYEKDVSIKTSVYNQNMVKLAPCYVDGEKFAVFPYCLTKKLQASFSDLRRYFLLQSIAKNTNNIIFSAITGISPYCYEQGLRRVLMLTNGNVDSFESIQLYVGEMTINRIYSLDRTGKMREVRFTREKGSLVVHAPLEYLSLTVLIFE